MKKSQNEQERKITKSFIEGNYQEDIWQRYYIDGMTGDLIRSIGDNQKETGDVGREDNRREEKYWK